LILLPWRWPARAKTAAYAVAVAVLLFLCLAPSADLPPERLWDKAEHGLAWMALAATGLVLWPQRGWAVAAFAVALGAAVEVLQATPSFGRDGDWRDWIADAVGVGATLLAAQLGRGLRRRPG
jgi:hypothetical protein